MNNWIKCLAAAILVFALAACGNEADGKTEPETSNKEKQDADKKKDELSAADIYKKALAATGDQNSMHIIMDIDHNVSVPERDFKSTTKMNTDLDLIIKPFALHQVAKTSTGEEKMAVEWYATDTALYLYEESEDMWFDMPEEDRIDIVGDMTETVDQFLFLELFEEFGDEFTVDESDSEYTIKLASSGDKFNNIIEELLVEDMLAEFEEDEEVEIGDIDVKSIKLEFSIAKETYFTNGFILDLESSLKIDGVKMVITQKTKTLVSEINKLETIEIPQDILDNAIKYEEIE